MEYLLGLDIGTSGVKAVLIDADGDVVQTDTCSYPLSTPRAGWAEQNPGDWWEATVEVIGRILQASKIDSSHLAGISFSGQMHSSVFLDKNREVIRPAILWSDTRTSAQCEEIYELVGGLENLIDMVSNPALEGFTAPKILWLRENEPENFERVDKVLLPKDYIRFRLTGELNTEVSDGAGTLLMDVEEKDWSDDILSRLDIERDMLPPVLGSISVAGRITGEAAAATGLKAGTPVVAGGADNACGAVGSGIVHEGRVMVSIGSSGVVLAQSDSPVADNQGRIHLFNHSRPDSWYMMGVMLSAGMSYSWLQESMYGDRLDFGQLDELAAEVSPGSDGLVFLPYLYGERTPHADASARGVFFGISGKHREGHFARSVMEGVTFGLRDSLELIKDKGIEIEEVRATGGGAKSEIWQQILADIFGEEISLLNVEEGPGFGAALIAGVGVGVFKNFAEVEREIIETTKTISPKPDNTERYQKFYQIYRDLYPALKDNYSNLADLQE
ncbi:MAG: xylulokinase [Halanaerobiaceae bacterium]